MPFFGRQSISEQAVKLQQLTALPNIPLVDRIALSPWQKLLKYKRFPFKLIVHILLTVLVTVQVFLFSSGREAYLYSAGDTIINRFLPAGFIPVQASGTGYNSVFFYKSNDVIKFVKQTVNNYYSFVNSSIDFFAPRTRYPDADTDAAMNDMYGAAKKRNTSYIIPIQMHAELFANMNFHTVDYSVPLDKSVRVEDYVLTMESPLGPFNASHEETQAYFHRLIYFTLSFDFFTLDIQKAYPECIEWSITMQFDFSQRAGRCIVNMKYDIGLCDTTQQAMNFEQVISTPVLWIGICVMIFSFISFVLVCKAMCSTYNTLKKMKTDKLFRNYSTYGSFKPKPPSTPIPNEKKSVLFASDGEEIITVPKNMEKLSFWEKLSFFNPWHPITLASSLMAFLSSIMTLCNLTYRFITLTPTNITLGISAIMVWTNLVQYLAHAPKFYVLITALRKGLPNIIRFIIGAMPILIGYAMCGTILFGSYSKYFKDMQVSFVTLFSLANGDVIHDTFDMIGGQSTVIAIFSRIYLITFVVLFSYSVINIFILIMEDAFFNVKEKSIAEDIKQTRKRELKEDRDRKKRIKNGDETVGLTSPLVIPNTPTVNHSEHDMYGNSFMSYHPSETDEVVQIYDENADRQATVKALLKQVTELKKLGNLNDKQSALVDQIEDSASNLSDE